MGISHAVPLQKYDQKHNEKRNPACHCASGPLTQDAARIRGSCFAGIGLVQRFCSFTVAGPYRPRNCMRNSI